MWRARRPMRGTRGTTRDTRKARAVHPTYPDPTPNPYRQTEGGLTMAARTTDTRTLSEQARNRGPRSKPALGIEVQP